MLKQFLRIFLIFYFAVFTFHCGFFSNFFTSDLKKEVETLKLLAVLGVAFPSSSNTTSESTTPGSGDTIAPNAPYNISAIAINTSQIDLSWSPGTDNATSQANLVYEICQTTTTGGCSSFSATYTKNSGSTYTQTFSTTGLTALTYYYFSIRSRDSAGNVSIASPEISAKTPSYNTTATPTFAPSQGTYGAAQNVAITSGTSGNIICYTINGATPVCSTGGCTTGTLYSSIVAVSSNSTVKAVACAAGYVSSSVATASYIIDTVSPSTPAGFTATSINENQIDLSWSASSDNFTARTNLVYEICKTTSSGGCSSFVAAYTIPSGGQLYSVTGLLASTTYYFSIRTRDGVGNTSAATAEISKTTPGTGTVGTPTFSPSQGSYNSAQTLSITSTTAGNTICFTTNGDTPACAVGSCTTGIQYTGSITVSSVTTVKAQACATGLLDSQVNSAVYNVDTAPPSMPLDLTILRNLTDFTSANASWNASTDNVTAQPNIIYQICQSTISGSCASNFIATYTTNPGATSFAISGLATNVLYYYVMRAIDDLGNVSSPSSESTIRDYNNIFTATGSMGSARQRHTATLLPDGKVLITGGGVSTAEIFDPAGNAGVGSFTATGSMGSARFAHTATLLPNGKVLITGGHNGTNTLSSAEIFDPAGNGGVGSFTTTGSMGSARYIHTATLLPNGKVLITGGHNGVTVVPSAEIFDPAGGVGFFTATGSMGSAKYIHTATLLPNGKVFVAGGSNGAALLSSVEIFDPAGNGGVGSFTATGSMGSARYIHTATLLPNGKVLITGGHNGAIVVPSAEIFR